jgi:hypothetical protein
MIKKIKRSVFLAEHSNFPQANYNKDEYIFPDCVGGYVLSFESKSAKGHAKTLSLEIVKLILSLGVTDLVFLGDTKTPWLYQENDYKPVREALEYLKNNNIGSRFNGALQLDNSSIQIFIKHLFWLSRCNAALPYFHFSDLEMNIIGTICKYGNLHFYTLNESIDSTFNNAIEKTKFEIMGERSCGNQFSKSSKINHRQTIVV